MNSFLFVVMVVLSIIGWITNAVNENNKKGQAGGKQQRPQKKRRLQDELESFLNELQGEKPKPQQRKPQRQTDHQQGQQRKRRPRDEAKNTSRSTRQRGSSKSQASASRLQSTHEKPRSVFENDDSRQVGSGNLGQGLKQHVENYSSHHPGTLVDELNEKKTSSQLHAPKRSSSAGRKVFELLHSADSVRTAIVLSEILQPPVSQRPGRF